MRRPKVRVLAVGGEEARSVEPHLENLPCFVEWAPDGRTAVLLAARMTYQHLLVGFPLPDMEVEEFLGELRRPDGASATARMLLLTTEKRREEIEEIRDEGFITGVVAVDGSDVAVERGLISFLKAAPRVPAALRVRMVAIEEGAVVEGETVNLSESGLLVRSELALERGDEVEIEISMPRGVPLRATALVVRQPRPEYESVQGMGLRFLAFEGDDQVRLEVLIRGLLAESVG